MGNGSELAATPSCDVPFVARSLVRYSIGLFETFRFHCQFDIGFSVQSHLLGIR